MERHGAYIICFPALWIYSSVIWYRCGLNPAACSRILYSGCLWIISHQCDLELLNSTMF